MNQLAGKVALVTGAANNLGRAIAVHLAKQNIKVAVHYHTSKRDAQKTLSEVIKYSSGLTVQTDLKDPEEVSSMVRTIELELGSIDILINLVGNFIYQPITQTSFDEFRDVLESNLYSTFLTCQHLLPQMKKGKWGRVINFGCVGADSVTVRKKTTPYYIAKTGVIMLTKVLAYEYAKYGITINSVSPGILETSIAKPSTPTGIYAQIKDILNAIDFLLKEESGYINGANLEVAGGWRPGFK